MTDSRLTVTNVEPLDGRWLRLTFGDGAAHEVDVTELLQDGGVFSAIRDDDAEFRAVRVDGEFGTISWPGNVDLDPDVLRGDQPPATGLALPRNVVQPA